MKKFYSFVLMAMMLLVGTNAWANYAAGWLQEQFDNIQADGQTHTIVMDDDIILENPVYLGTATEDAPRKSIILDMHGHNITMNATTWLKNHSGVFCSVFNITHGELLIRNEDKSNTSLIQMIGVASGNYNNIFNVVGSYRSNRWVKNGNQYDTIPVDKTQLTHAKNTRDADGGWFTHLEIGDGVKLYAANEVYGSGISIDGYYTDTHGLISSAPSPAASNQVNKESIFPNSALSPSAGNTCLFEREDAPQYNTAILKGGASGVAYGVRVDVYGDIEFATGATAGKSYGIKLNGGLRSSLRSGEVFHNQNLWYIDEAYARTYGATAAPTTNTTKTFTISEEVYQNHRNDTVDAPFVYIHKTAHIIAASTLNEATAVYCSGYGKTLIEGACSGNSGVNVKSGTVELHDAEITCTATATSVYKAENGNNATGTGAVVVNSVDGRAGGIEVIISGDSKVSTDYGYAIKETVTATDNETKVSSISIEGGTIQGGAATATSGGGAIIVSEETKKEVVIYGANLTGNNDVEVGGEGTLTDLLPKNEQTSEPEGHVTPVLDPVTGKTTLVISAGAAPDPGNKVSNQAKDASVKWQGPDFVTDEITASINKDHLLRLTELQINDTITAAEDEASENPAIVSGQPRTQTLYIRNGATLEVKRVILGPAARIIVEAGGKLIITGTQGIVAPVYKNIKLESSETAQAIFLFHPNVTSNRHPNATVELTSKGYCKNGDYSKKVWQRFGVPAYTSKVEEGAVTRKSTNKIEYNYAGWIDSYDYAIDNWKSMADDEVFVPFQCYAASSVATEANVTKYTFTCPLMGNSDITLVNNPYTQWNYYANSYMAPIDIQSMLTSFLSTNAKIDNTIHVYQSENNWWDDINLTDFEFFAPAQTKIDPMQAFIFKKSAEGAVEPVISYKHHVYNPDPSTAVVAAPARANNNAYSAAIIEIVTADGQKDRLYLVESERFSNEYDNGYDASKYMNESFNIFADVNGESLSKVATDKLDGTVISMTTKAQTSFTMTFSNVANMEYAVRDMLTGTETAIEEGATYMFSTAANANVDGRFQIVPVAKMPTAVENIEATAAVKGIYTITGQFMGYNYHNLPNGIYVVDGKKIVK